MTARSSRLLLCVLAVGLAGVLAAACSSSPTPKHSSTATTRTLPHSVLHPHTTVPPTTAPPRPNTTPITVAGVEASISGSSATIQFQGPAVTGDVATAGAAFSDGGKQFSFTITGVSYGGGEVTTYGPPTNRITSVVVDAAANGVTVQLTISPAASNNHFSVSGNQVTVSVS